MKCSLRLGSSSWRAAMLAAVVAALAGCTTIREGRGGPGQRLDPWENWNRKVFNFNEDVDNAVLKPVATLYADVVPQPVRRSVTNFFNNFSDAWSAINNMLQGKFALGFEDATRVGANTLFGLGGILDVASEMGLEHHYEDFGQTLGRYGVGAGAYAARPARVAAGAFRRHGHADRLHAAADHQYPLRSARRDARDRRHLARQVHLHSRRLPAAAPQPRLRRRRPRDARAA
jgi:ABC-type transporter lipoprotein component MlaA